MELKPLVDRPGADQSMIFLSISLTILEFGISYSGLSLSSIFVSPYFSRLGLSSIQNSLIWLLPHFFQFISKPSCKSFLSKDRQSSNRSHVFLSMTAGGSLAGCLLFIFAGSISEWYFKQNITTHKLAEFYALVLGIFGFVLMQSTLMLASEILTEVLMNSHRFEGFFELWVFRWKSIGRVASYVLASLDIFQTYTLRVYYVRATQTVGDNLTFSYAFWMILQFFLLCFLVPIISTVDMSRLKLEENFFPPWSLIWNMPKQVKALVCSYFFAYGNCLMISIYATSWTNIALFANSAHGAKFLIRRREFDLGVSWGAFDMLILSLTSAVFSFSYSWINNEKAAWITGNLLSSIGLVLSVYYADDQLTFIFLPLCSCLFACICVTPFRVFNLADLKLIKICALKDEPHCGNDCKGDQQVLHIPPYLVLYWENILNLVGELSKFAALCVVPLAFLAVDRVRDSRWALEISACWAVLSLVFSLFI